MNFVIAKKRKISKILKSNRVIVIVKKIFDKLKIIRILLLFLNERKLRGNKWNLFYKRKPYFPTI
jgi:hypothetical protein